MEVEFFAVAGIKYELAEHLENVRFVIRSKEKILCNMIKIETENYKGEHHEQRISKDL